MKKIILLSCFLLSACAAAPKKANEALKLREPAQTDELVSQETYKALYQSLGGEITYENRYSHEQYQGMKNNNYLCMDVDGYGTVFPAGEVFQRRKRRFAVPFWVKCKQIPSEKTVEEILEETKAKELMRNGL